MRPLTLSLLLFWCFLVACRHEQPLTIDSSDPAADLPKLTLLTDPTVCATCHPTHYEEWQGSMHAYAAVDPAFIKMQKLGQKETNGQVDQFCVQCHSPIVSKLGLAPVNYENEDLPPIGLHGVSCQACHRISHVLEARNASFEYDSSSVIFGPLRQPVANTYHTSEYNAIFETSELCGACHNVVNPREIKIENTFDEWLQSPAAAAGQTCQSCHMPSYEGQAAVDGPTREVHRHFFVGVDVALIDFPDRERQRRMVESLLQSAAEISVNPARQARRNDFLPIEVMITSKTAGHHLPSGATADRQMWLSVKVSDAANGRVFYESGGLDANGDLMDRHSELAPDADTDLALYNQQMAGRDGEDVFFSWQAYAERTITIPPLATVRPKYVAFIPQDAGDSLRIEVALRFRTFPPFLLRKLGLPDLAAAVPIVDMATRSFTMPIVKDGS